MHQVQKQPPEVFNIKSVLKNFGILTGKYLQAAVSFLIKLQILGLQETATQGFSCEH